MDIESRVAGLERTVRRQRFAGLAVLLLVLVGGFLLGQAKPPKYVGIAASLGVNSEGEAVGCIYRLSANGKIEVAEVNSSMPEVRASPWGPLVFVP